ncbi:MAG: BatA domain-containing protein [Pirellulales bacterium]|nr:BatA domain-containing protein [Pirellulales bacterium]
MTFLNASLAIGTCACLIPVIIHLFNRRRYEVVRWGAMHLISPLMRTNRKRIRLEQLILLLVRMGLLALLALCMAGPVITGWNALSGNAKSSLALLLDNSYSMDAGAAAESNMDSAKRSAVELVEHQRRGSDVIVSLMGGGKLEAAATPTTNRSKVAQEVKQTSSGFGPIKVTDSFGQATRSLLKMQHAKRDLVVISDFQASDWSGDSASSLDQVNQLVQAMPIRPTITLMRVGVEANDNVSVQSIDIEPRAVAVQQPVRIRVNLRNHSDIPYPGLRVHLRVDEQDRQSDVMDLAAGKDGQVLFQHTFDDPGSHVIEVRADADSLHFDNDLPAVVPVWDRLPVLLVDGDPSDQPLQNETGFLQLALSPFLTAAKLPDSGANDHLPRVDLLEATAVPLAQFAPPMLAEVRVLVLANVPRLTAGQLRAVEAFVRQGNSLLIFPGSQIDVDWYRREMAAGSKLMAMTFGSLQSRRLHPNEPESDESTPGVAIADQRSDHAALELFNDARHGKLSDATIDSWYLLAPAVRNPELEFQLDDAFQPGSTPKSQDVQMIARLNNGDPLLMENSFGKGRVIVCTTACDDSWSDLPSRPFFLPLMQRLVTYLATAAHPRRNLAVGQTLVAQLPADAGPVTITRPDGQLVELTELQRDRSGLIQYSQTDHEGVYLLQSASLEPIHYAVVAPRVESNLQLLDEDQLGSLAQTLGATLVRSTQEFIDQDSQRRYGREVWRHLFWLALAFAVLEVLLQQWFSGPAKVNPTGAAEG